MNARKRIKGETKKDPKTHNKLFLYFTTTYTVRKNKRNEKTIRIYSKRTSCADEIHSGNSDMLDKLPRAAKKRKPLKRRHSYGKSYKKSARYFK